MSMVPNYVNRRYHKPGAVVCLVTLAHAEEKRRIPFAFNIFGEQDMKIFESGVCLT